jgi:hypothetical protein
VSFGAGALLLQAVALALVGLLVDCGLSWHMMAGGDGRAESPDFLLGTAGQAAVGELLGGNFQLGSGFREGGVVPREEHRAGLRLSLPLARSRATGAPGASGRANW